MARVEATVEVRSRVFEPQPPRPKRAPRFPEVLKRMFAPYPDARVVVIVAVDPDGNATVESVESRTQLSGFAEARFRDAALEPVWLPATDELGQPVAGRRRVEFVMHGG